MNENELKSLNIKVMSKTMEVFKFLCNNKQPDIVMPPSHFFVIENPFLNDPKHPIFAVIFAPEVVSPQYQSYPQSAFFFNKPYRGGITTFKFLINHQNIDVDLNDIFSKIIAFYINFREERSNFKIIDFIRRINHINFRYKVVSYNKYLYFKPLAFVNNHFVPINKVDYYKINGSAVYIIKDEGKEYRFFINESNTPVY